MEKGLPSWKCVDIYDDEDIGRVSQVHQMLWATGFVRLDGAMAGSAGLPPAEMEDIVIHYSFTRECDNDLLVSIPGFIGSWELDPTKAPSPIESISLLGNGSVALGFGDTLGWVTIDAKEKPNEFRINKDGHIYSLFRKALTQLLEDIKQPE